MQNMLYFCRKYLCGIRILLLINCLQVTASAVLACHDMLQYTEEQIQNIHSLNIEKTRELREKRENTHQWKRWVYFFICHLTYLTLS